MKPKTLVLMLIAVSCGLVASFMTSRYLSAGQQAPKEDNKVRVLVAKKKISGYTRLTDAEIFEERLFDQNVVPKDAVSDFEAVKGRVLKVGLGEGKMLAESDLVDPTQSSPTWKLNPGELAMSVKVNADTAGAGFLMPGDRVDVQQLAIEHRVRCIVVTGGFEPPADLLALARRFDVSVLQSPHDSATTAMLCRAAISVHHMLDDEFMTLREDEPLRSAGRAVVNKPFAAFPVVNERDEVVGVISKSDFLRKVNRRLILVDHNELAQAVHGADEVEILEIIDHHRIGAVSTAQPIFFLNDPVGSTSTIVADCFFRHGVELPRPVAGLLLAGLVSDTLNLTSPTTTPRDAAILKRLETLADVNARQFTEKLFSSGSILISKPPDQAITADCKEYQERGRSFSVAQIEEVGLDNFWKCKTEVLAALENYRQRHGYFASTLLVTDVVRQNSLLLVAGPRELLDLVDYPEVEPRIYELADVVSRKKQLLPYLTDCLQRLA